MADDLSFGFTAAELEANRRGELLSTQFPPIFWKLVGLCVVGLVIVLCLRWVLQNRHDRMSILVAGAALGCLVPAAWLAHGLSIALRDRMDARACAYTHISSGVRGSAWGRGLYYIDFGTREFPSRRHGARTVQKGSAYTVYYACHAGTLASLEPAPADWKLPGAEQHLAELQELFGFDDADLAANRVGSIRFHQYPFGDLAWALLFTVGCAMGSLAALMGFMEEKKILMLLFGLAWGAITVGVAYGKRGLVQDAFARRACVLVGPVTSLTGRLGLKNRTYWRLTVDGTTLELQRRQGIALVRVGSPYRVHYLCHSQRLISIEPLS